MNQDSVRQDLAFVWLVSGSIVALVALGVYPTVWGGPLYPLMHFCFGLGFPLLVAGWFGAFSPPLGAMRLGFVVTGLFHFGHELLADPVSLEPYIVDWVEVISGALGMGMASCLILGLANVFSTCRRGLF